MSWRPEDNWARKVLDAYMVQAGWRPQNMAGARALVEYAADAMLEALKALPISREINWEYMDSDTYNNIGLAILTQYQGNKVNGLQVFIPDETKGG